MKSRFFVNFIQRWLRHPMASLVSLTGLVLLVPLGTRMALGWNNPLGYLSDLGIAGLLIVLLYRRPWWLALPVLMVWCLLSLAATELVSAVGRLPTLADINYLIDPQFLENSTGGDGLGHPWLAGALLLALLIWLGTQWGGQSPQQRRGLASTCLERAAAAIAGPWRGAIPASRRSGSMAPVQSAASAADGRPWRGPGPRPGIVRRP